MSIGNSPEEDRPSVGQALQQARRDAEMSVDDVSATTRVRVPIVQAIEQDDFSRCGGDVYARGHVRSLARAVGLDGDELVAQFDEEHGGRPAPTPPAALFEAEEIRPESRRPNWTAAMVAAIVAVVGFVGFTLFNGGDDGGSSVADSEKSTTATPSPSKSGNKPSPSRPSDPKPDPSDSAVAGAPADKVTVRLTAVKGSSWISALDHNGRQVYEGVLKQGDSKTVTDDERLKLVVGNAGGVQAHVNGKEVKLGEAGEVAHVTYTKGDPQEG
ncbi:RodZ domain-containing protein [Streptomyces sp. NPDC005438]|uniref:helix-turn-helix domain-containing protein n=1 Tax=Streptomyces sp. NPDC005438 TaxID=3156880 RepID=UPI0033A359EF